MVMLFKVDVLSLSCVFFITACAPGLRPATSRPPLLNQSSSQVLLRAIEENRAQVSSLRGRARIKVVSTRENLRADCLVFIQRPDRLRLEILNPMKMPLFLFLHNGEEWINYSFAENRYLKGEDKEKVTLVGLRVKDVISFASGQLPLVLSNRENVACHLDGEDTILTLTSGEGEEKIWINHEGNQEDKGEFYDLFGELKLRVGFKKFQRAGDILFPHQIEIYLPKDHTWITLTYEEIQLNAELEDDLFQFTPPPYAERGDISFPNPESLTPNP
jgi:outer membrane lipoprotein-sorting protein